jgi:hypothetical protein
LTGTEVWIAISWLSQQRDLLQAAADAAVTVSVPIETLELDLIFSPVISHLLMKNGDFAILRGGELPWPLPGAFGAT